MYKCIFSGSNLHVSYTSYKVYLHVYILCYSVQYILLGAEEGLFSLLVTNNPDPVMEQVRPVYAYTLYATCSLLPSAVKLRNSILDLSIPSTCKYSRVHAFVFYVMFLIPRDPHTTIGTCDLDHTV